MLACQTPLVHTHRVHRLPQPARIAFAFRVSFLFLVASWLPENWLYAQPRPCDSTSPEAAPVHLEITQGIQLADNSVPLVAGRATMVRATIGVACVVATPGDLSTCPEGRPDPCDCGWNDCFPPLTNKVRGELFVTDPDLDIVYFWAPQAINQGATIRLYPPDPNHIPGDPIDPTAFPVDEFNSTLNFLIPAGQLPEGPVRFTVRLPMNSACRACGSQLTVPPKEDDQHNPVPPIVVGPSRTLNVVERFVPWVDDPNLPPPPIDVSHILQGRHVRYFYATYPLTSLGRDLSYAFENFAVGFDAPIVEYDFAFCDPNGGTSGMSNFLLR